MKTLLIIIALLMCAVPATGQQTYSVPRCLGTNDTAAFQSIITAAAGNPRSIEVPRRSEAQRCALNTSTIPSNITLVNITGSGIKVNTGQTLTVTGPRVNPPGKTMFYNVGAGQGTLVLSGHTYVDTTGSETLVCYAKQMAGADVGAKVNACDALLGADKGEIWLTGGGVISTQIVISAQHTLRAISGAYTATTNGVAIRLKDNSSMLCDSWGPTFAESTGVLGDTYPHTIISAYDGFSSDSGNGTQAENISIKGCHVVGHAPVTGTASINNASQTLTATTAVFTTNMVGWTVWIPGASFPNTGSGAVIVSLTGASPSTTVTVDQANTASTVTGASISAVNFSSTPQAIALGNCLNCVAEGNWIDSTHSIGLQVGGGSGLGFYAKGVSVKNNYATNVASQVLAVVNAEDVVIDGNIILNSGQLGGPGSVPIDVEPNTGDRLRRVTISNNHIDSSGSPINPTPKVQSGIAIQNGNGIPAAQYGPVIVEHNSIFGALSTDANPKVASNGIHLIGADNTIVRHNYVRGINTGIRPTSSHYSRIEGNTLVDCGLGADSAIFLEGSTNITLRNNSTSLTVGYTLTGDQNIGEDGTSGTNTYENNVGNLIGTNASSTVISNTTSGANREFGTHSIYRLSTDATLSAASTARVRFNSNQLQLSNNGGAFSNLLTALDWAAPGAIGGTTPAAGAFTTVSGSTSLTVGAGTAVNKILSASASLNYAQASANTCEVLTITVTGTADDSTWTVSVGVPHALANHNTTATWASWVSGADTVSVRRCVISGDGSDPAAATVRASAVKF